MVSGTRQQLEDDAYTRYSDGDSGAYDELRTLLAAHAHAVMFSVLRHSDKTLVLEAVNEVLLSLDKFEGKSKFTTWAHRIMLRVAYQSRRKQRRNKEISLNTPGMDFPTSPTIGYSDTLLTIRQLLTDNDHKIFQKLILDGATQEEAAEELKMSQPTLVRRWKCIQEVLAHGFGKQLPDRG